MKFDIDSILYIVITVVILIISGLGSRRKKRAMQMEAEAQARTASEEEGDSMEAREEDLPQPPPTFNIFDSVRKVTETVEQQVSSDPMSRLEKFLTGQEIQERQQSRVVSLEGESLEETVDEEEQIMDEIRSRNEPETVEDDTYKIFEPTEDNEKKKNVTRWFENVDEIKRAVIYSEILKRKY
jgi:hypothetical protein